MKGKATWATTLVLAVLTRLLITDAGPLQHAKQRSFTIEEIIEDPEREIDDTYSKLVKKRTHIPVEPLGGTVTAAADAGNGQEPYFHFEVHTVQHNMGHLMSADQKLRAVIRHSAGLDEQVNDIALPNLTGNKNENNVGDKNSVQTTADNSVASLELENEQKKSDDTEDALNPRHMISNTETRDVDETSPVALARQDPRFDGSSVAGVHSASSIADVYFLAVVAGCSVAGIAGLLLAAVCWYRLHKKIKAASEVDYPAYGVTGPSAALGKESRGAGSPGDRKLAQSAQMYHYQHQKQQMIASERLASDTHPATAGSDVESDEENEEGDYTVFECPGLATNGEMEVRNPLFNDQTPASTPADSSHSTKK